MNFWAKYFWVYKFLVITLLTLSYVWKDLHSRKNPWFGNRMSIFRTQKGHVDNRWQFFTHVLVFIETSKHFHFRKLSTRMMNMLLHKKANLNYRYILWCHDPYVRKNELTYLIQIWSIFFCKMHNSINVPYLEVSLRKSMLSRKLSLKIWESKEQLRFDLKDRKITASTGCWFEFVSFQVLSKIHNFCSKLA